MGFLDGLIGALGGLADEILQVLVYLFNLLIQVFEFIWSVIGIVADFMLKVFKSIGSFFVHLWDNFFKQIFVKLFHGIQALTTFLESKLRPVIKFLLKVRKYIDQIYKAYVAPFLKLIQHIRQFLQILKLLHVKFAVELDKILGQVQRDVQGVFLQIRGILNTTIDLLNILADPTKLLRKPTMVLSIRRSINALIRQTTGMPPGWYFPSPRPSAPKGLGFLPANFDPSNPDHNPPPSYYFGLDSGVPSFDFLGDGDTIPDESVDGLSMFDYFDDSAWAESDCVDIEACLLEAQQAAITGV
jgi:hypothetical protein